MLNHKLLGSVSSLPSDANFENVSLLLSGDGTNGAQNNTFLDSSTNNFTITRNGNTTQGSFSPYGSNWSNYFPGTSYLNTATNGTAFAMGTGDYTIEGWGFKSDSTDDVGLFGTEATGIRLYWYGGILYHQCGLNSTGGSGVTVSETAPSLNTWFHWACVRSSGTIRLYINGVSTTSTGSATANINSTYMTIGREMVNYTNYYWVGNISNVRAVKGTAVYTSNFTPSTTPLSAISGTSLLTCQSNRFIDNSSNAFALTVNGSPSVQRFSPFNPTAPYSTSVIGGSGYFDGSGDYLATPSNSAFALNGGDFTIECWVYLNSYSSTNQSRVFYPVSNNQNFDIGGNGGGSPAPGKLSYYDGNGVDSAAGVVKLNAWTHIACVRSGTTVSLYANGVRVATGTQATTSPSATVAYIGSSGTTDFINGYISDYRIVKGTAVYSGTTYTVPTAPLTAITNTQLLLNSTNAGIPDLAMQNDLETVGNAQVSTSVKKYGTGSLAFDGTGDYLKLSSNPQLATNTGDMTLEMWIYPASTTSLQTFFDSWLGSGNGFYLWTDIWSGGYAAIDLLKNDTTYYYNSNSPNIALNTWSHLALTRSSNTVRLFVNGIQQWSTTVTDSWTNQTAWVGWGTGNGNIAFNGYIDDLRITKGLARYTANFTPPTAALPSY